MPTMFMDGGGNAQEVWNEEAPFRQGQPPESMKVRLKAEIEADMDILAGDVVLGEEPSWKITNNEPDEVPPFPGDTAYGTSEGLFGPVQESD